MAVKTTIFNSIMINMIDEYTSGFSIDEIQRFEKLLNNILSVENIEQLYHQYQKIMDITPTSSNNAYYKIILTPFIIDNFGCQKAKLWFYLADYECKNIPKGKSIP